MTHPKKAKPETKIAALNAVCPYYTMFPIEYPLSILRRYRRKTIRVLDPFCGRGTTIFAARLLGHEGFGIDSSPVAVAIAKAKVANCDADDVIHLANKILNGSNRVTIPTGDFWDWAYDRNTLKAVCRLRAGLLNARVDAANVLRAICLGALHGPLSKNPESASYFSNQMPRTFASKPAYSVKFWRKRKMKPRSVNVSAVIQRRLTRLGLEKLKRPRGLPEITQGDARMKPSYRALSGRVETVISSPPYYGMKTYIADQWLRNWFVGGPPSVPYSGVEQLSHDGPAEFAASLGKVWDQVGDVLDENGRSFDEIAAERSRAREEV